MSITGLPGQGPVRVGIPIADLCAGIFCAWGIAVALIEREKSGQGPVGEVVAAAGAALHARLPGGALADARRSRRSQAGNNHPTSIPTGVFRTRDGHMNIAVSGHKIWLRLLRARSARPSWPTHPDYETAALRSQHRDQLHVDLEKHLVARDTGRVGRGAERGRRPVGADLLDRPGVRRPAGAHARHRAEGRRGRLPRPAGDAQPHAEPGRRPSSRAGRAHRRGPARARSTATPRSNG